MNKNRISFLIIWVLSLVFNCQIAYSQTYSSDAILIELKNNVALIKSSGIAPKKKDAIEMAVKSAIHTYLINGIEGLNNGSPLIGEQSSTLIDEYLESLFSQGRYSVFARENEVEKDAIKRINKGYIAIVDVNIYFEAIYKDLVRNKIIGKSLEKTTLLETQNEIALPTIMVIPYCTEGQTFLTSIQQNTDMRMAMAKITEGFILKGVETKDFEQNLKNAEQYEARQGGLSLDDAILNGAGADVAVQVDISKDASYEGLRINMRLTAIEVATGNTLASKSETSARKKASASIICSAMAELMIDDFLKQISTRLAHKISKGNTISVNFTIDANSTVDMDTEMGNTYLPLSDAIIIWIKDNAKKGKYHQKGRSVTLLSLDEIQIQNKSAEGQDMNINDFSLELYKYLRNLGVIVKRNIVGNTLNVTIM